MVASQDGRQTQRRLGIHLNQLRVISAEVGRVYVKSMVHFSPSGSIWPVWGMNLSGR